MVRKPSFDAICKGKKTGEKYPTDQQVKHAQTCTSTRHAPAHSELSHSLIVQFEFIERSRKDGANNNKNVI